MPVDFSPVGAPRQRIGIDLHAFSDAYGSRRSHVLGLFPAVVAQAPEFDFHLFVDGPVALRQAVPSLDLPHVTLVDTPTRHPLWREAIQWPWARHRAGLDLLHVQQTMPLGRTGNDRAVACTLHAVSDARRPLSAAVSPMPVPSRRTQRAIERAQLLLAANSSIADGLSRCSPQFVADAPSLGPAVDSARFFPGHEGLAFVHSRGLLPERYLCCIGRIRAGKHHTQILQAFARMPEPRLPLVVIGAGGTHVEALQALARDLDILRDVRFLEDVDDRELPALLRHAALAIHPGGVDSAGLAVAEAMASGIAVVAAEHPSMAGLCHGWALTVDPHRTTDMAAAVLTLLADPLRRTVLAKRARTRMSSLTWSVPATTVVSAYRRFFAARNVAP